MKNLTHSTPKIIYTLAAQLGLNSGGWGLGFGSLMPAQGGAVPAAYIYIYGATPLTEGQIVDQDNSIKQLTAYGFQIRIRHSVYETGFQKATQIIAALSQIKWQTIVVETKTYMIQKLLVQGGVIPMPRQEQQLLEHFSTNWLMKAQEV